MAVPGKRLFWISIIVVELVLGYVLWKPVRDHWRRSHRAAGTQPASQRPETAQPAGPKPQAPAGTQATRPHRAAFRPATPPPPPAQPLGRDTSHRLPSPEIRRPTIHRRQCRPEDTRADSGQTCCDSATLRSRGKLLVPYL